MNDEAHESEPLDELPGDLRTAVERLKQRPVPEAALQRALDRAARCGSPRRWTNPRLRPTAVLGFAAAVAACITLAVWFLRPSDLWADVVKAVHAKPWIHVTGRDVVPGRSSEFWISTSRAVGGSRSEEQISFFDDRLRIVYRYQPQKGILYRLPAPAHELAEGQRFLDLFQGLFRGDSELKTELVAGMILKEQKRRQIEKDGRKWEEYELVVQIPSGPPDADVRMTFVVDDRTRLPHSMTMKYPGGESEEFTFDYPENGPVDIYALGVPKDAKLVDRVPTGDMSRILAAIQAGRDRFDDFHAIVIRNQSPDLFPTAGKPIPMAFLVWKKGNRWRVEIGIPPPEYFGNHVLPDEGKMEWMREKFEKAYFTTHNVCDGKSIYQGGRKHFELLGRTERVYNLCWESMSTMPTYWCFPATFPAPNDRTEETVDLNPSEGPPNTILVTSRLVDLRGHDPANVYKCQRYWLDPARGYAVVRYQILIDDPALKPPTDRDLQPIMDQWEQTPSGVWYPTRTRNEGTMWYHFFLDFQAEIPDELFEPAKRTVLTDRYPVGS